MRKTYKGQYKIKKPAKYIGDASNVTYRSSWERSAFVWAERNPDVVKWSSEELVIPYICGTDKRVHRYFTDMLIQWKDGSVTVVEIKPKKETFAPVAKKGKSKKRLVEEGLTYIKNISKWEFAKEFCTKRGWTFEVWHEDVLRAKGVKIL